jgi:hypothetical protein
VLLSADSPGITSDSPRFEIDSFLTASLRMRQQLPQQRAVDAFWTVALSPRQKLLAILFDEIGLASTCRAPGPTATRAGVFALKGVSMKKVACGAMFVFILSACFAASQEVYKRLTNQDITDMECRPVCDTFGSRSHSKGDSRP